MGRTQSVVGQEGKSIELTAPISMASDIWRGRDVSEETEYRICIWRSHRRRWKKVGCDESVFSNAVGVAGERQ